MAKPKEILYVPRTDLYYKPLDIIDEKALADACNDKAYSQTLCQVSDSVVRLGVLEGKLHWHKHKNDDEFFYVVQGKLFVDLHGRTIELAPREGVVVPKGRVHRTRAPKRTVVLMVETAEIVPAGDWQSVQTRSFGSGHLLC